jgi:hemoglobin/transferrin/lactoferrin receptor protein
MVVYNIDEAHFSGWEFSGRYTIGGFSADLAANYYTDVTFCRTPDTCGNRTLYADYSTNHVPPKYSVDLTLSQKLFSDALTVGGRISYVGQRAAGHGEVTAQGLSQFIALVDWEPYTLVDTFAEYKIGDGLTAEFHVNNLTDTYYVDPLSLVQQPAPGRTFYSSLTAQF